MTQEQANIMETLVVAALRDLGAHKLPNHHQDQGVIYYKLGDVTISYSDPRWYSRGAKGPKGVYVAIPGRRGFFVPVAQLATLDLKIAQEGQA